MPAVDLAEREAQKKAEEAAARQPGQAEDEEVIEATTAFLVYIREDSGQIVMTHDVNAPISVKRAPNADEVYGTMQVICKDLVANQNAGMTANAVIGIQQEMAKQMMQQQAVQNDPNIQAALKSFTKKKGG